MREYLPNKAEVATLIFGIGLGIVFMISADKSWALAMLFVWPIFFIAMPLLYIIGKRKDNLDKKSLKAAIKPNKILKTK